MLLIHLFCHRDVSLVVTSFVTIPSITAIIWTMIDVCRHHKVCHDQFRFSSVQVPSINMSWLHIRFHQIAPLKGKKNGRVMKLDLHEKKVLYYTCTWCCPGDRLFKRYNSVSISRECVSHPPMTPRRLLFSCLPLRLFPVACVYYSPLWFPCNGGEILNNLFSLQGKKSCCWMNPERGAMQMDFLFWSFQVNIEMYTM